MTIRSVVSADVACSQGLLPQARRRSCPGLDFWSSFPRLTLAKLAGKSAENADLIV